MAKTNFQKFSQEVWDGTTRFFKKPIQLVGFFFSIQRRKEKTQDDQLPYIFIAICISFYFYFILLFYFFKGDQPLQLPVAASTSPFCMFF